LAGGGAGITPLGHPVVDHNGWLLVWLGHRVRAGALKTQLGEPHCSDGVRSRLYAATRARGLRPVSRMVAASVRVPLRYALDRAGVALVQPDHSVIAET